jgi:hypothetical protein
MLVIEVFLVVTVLIQGRALFRKLNKLFVC